ALLLLLLAAVLAKVLMFHARLISYPYPLDPSEPAQGLLAQGVAEGRSLGDLSKWPGMSDHDGPIYGMVTGWLCRHGLACGLQGQRLLCALFLGFILAIFVADCRRLGAPWPHTLALALWVYELLLVHFTPVAGPDALGLLLWFAGLSLPFLVGDGLLVLALSAVLFALAGLTKVYFLCGPLFLGLGLLMRKRKLEGFVFVQALALGVAFWWLERWGPFNLYVAVLSRTHNPNFDWGRILMQLWVVLVLASPAFVLLLVLAGLGRIGGGGVDAAHGREGHGGGSWALYGALGLLLFVAVFGRERGGQFSRLIQLSVLPFAVCFSGVCARSGRSRFMGTLLLAALAVNVLGGAEVALHHGFAPDSPALRQWENADALVQAAHFPVVSSDLDLSVEAKDLPVYDTGLSDFHWTLRVPPTGWKARLFPRIGLLQARWRAWQGRYAFALRDPRTDLV
ncbi:MAG: hypothetical protein ACREKE_07410, partial [bacterium]